MNGNPFFRYNRRMLAPLLVAIGALALPAQAAPQSAPAAPTKVVLGIYVNQIYQIDFKANHYGVDFWLWFRWPGTLTGPPLLESFDVVGGRISSRTNVIKKKLADGIEYGAVRVNAIINKQWDLTHFPFDDHKLRLRIEDAERETSQVIFEADTANEGVDPDITLSGWSVARFGHELTDHVYKSNYGDTTLATGNQSHYSRYSFEVELKRSGSGRFFKFFFGLFMATLVAWCGFFIRPKDASPRVSVSVGALFAAAAVTIAINNQLPDVGYLTLADKMVFLTLAMILFSLFGTVTSLSLHYLSREASHRRIDRIGAVVFPLIYLVALVLIVR